MSKLKRKKQPASKAASKAASKVASAQSEKTETGPEAGSTDADALLKADRRSVESLFQNFRQTEDAEQKSSIVKQICTSLRVHALLEEEILYPACLEKGVEDNVLDEAQVQHDAAKILILELLAANSDAFYDATVTVLSEYIKHHVSAEEKSDGIFAKARENGVDMAALGQRLQTRKAELVAMADSGSLPPPRFIALQSPLSNQKDENMNRQMSGRDENGRFTSDDNSGRGGGRGRQMQGRNRDDDGDDERRGRGSQDRERDENGRFMSEDDDGRRGSRGRDSQSRQRDEDGRFMSNDDRGGNNGGRQSRRDEDDDNNRRSSGGRSQGGWFGDSEGHSEAARRGWANR